MSVNPKTLVEKFIRDSKGRSRLAAVTGVLAVFTVLITVGVLTFPAISISGSEEALREQGIDITTGQQQQEAEVVAPPADEAPMVVYDEASQAADAESSENVAEAITEETTVGDVVVSEEADLAADAPVEGEAIEATDVEAEGETEAEAEEELDPEKAEAEEKVEASDAAKAALATADLSSSRLIIGTSNADALAEETNVVASFDNIYLLQYASAEEAAKGFLRYFDIADYVTPDVAVEVADDSIEDNSDPEEEVITTDNVYTEETNPFVELEVAIEENQAEIEAEATKQDALIAVIDTGAALEGNVIESVSMLGENGADDNGHGQRMVDYVVEENENARILSIKALGADGKGDVSAVVAAFNYAIERGANIINLSASAYASEENAALVDVVKRAEEAGIIVVGSAGNNGFNAKFYIPGNIPEATIVGASDDKGQRIKQSNFGETVDYNFWAGSTSEAAARMSGFVSANGEDGVAAVLNQGRIFSTDYIAAPAEEEVVEGEPAEGEEAVEGEGEETPDEANRDTDFVAQAVVSQLIRDNVDKTYDNLGNQSNQDGDQLRWSKRQIKTSGSTARVCTWDALNEAVRDKNINTIILDKNVFKEIDPAETAGERAHALAAYYTIEVDHDLTIKASDNMSAIYHDAQPKEEMTSYFKVINGATLSLDGVTLTGMGAYTAHNPVDTVFGSVALEKVNGKWEIRMYAKGSSTPYYLDALSVSGSNKKLIGGENPIGSVQAVALGTLNDDPVAGQPFAIREKYPQANGNYRFLVVEGTTLKLKEVNPDNIASAMTSVIGHHSYTDEDGNVIEEDVIKVNPDYAWEILETPGSYLYNNNGNTAHVIIHDGYFDRKDWRTNPPRLQVTTSGYRVQTTRTPYDYASTTNAYFVQVENGVLNVENSTLEHAHGGIAPIYANTAKATVNITGNSSIRYNRAQKSQELQNNNWDETEAAVFRSWGVANRDSVLNAARGNWESAGAVFADNGATVTIGVEGVNNDANSPKIYGNHGQTGAIRAKGGSTVTQYYSTLGGSTTIDGNVGARGGAVRVSGTGTTYNMRTGSMMNNFSIEDGGAIRVDNDATFNMGYLEQNKPQGESAPVIANNEAHYGAGGGILVASDNVNLYNGEIKENITYKMGGGIYVDGDNMANTSKLTFKNWYGDTNSFVYDNYAFVGGHWDAYGHLNGDGGGLWFCNWGSYLYDENFLQIFDNVAGVDKNTRQYVAEQQGRREEKKYDKVYKGNGDDFSKQGAKSQGQGLGAGFVVHRENSAGWEFDRPDKTHGTEWSTSPYNDNTALDTATVFPTERNMNLKNRFTMSTEQKKALDPKVRLIIHDNGSPNGGGIGCNGIIVFEEVPVHFKKIQASLALDKNWTENGQDVSASIANKKIKIDLEIVNKDGSVYKTYPSVTLDGKTKNSILAQESRPENISWDGWHVKFDLPTFVFKIDDQLIAANVSNDDRINRDDHTAVDAAAVNITTGDDGYAPDLDYGEPQNGTPFTVDATTGTVSFTNWSIRVTETILDGNDNPAADASSYNLSMDDLYYRQLDTGKYVDTGHYFYLYTDSYELSSKLTNSTSKIKINKVDQNDEPLPGATFAIYKVNADNTETLVEQKTMGEKETNLVFKGLSAGTYKVREISAPDGYNKHVGDYIITIDKNGATGRAEYVAVDSTTGQLAVGGNLLYIDKLPANEAALNALSDKYAVNNLTTTTFGSHYPLIVGLYENGTTQTGLATSTDYVVSATDAANYPGIVHLLKERKHVGSPDHNHASIIYGYADSAFTLANLKDQGPDTINQFTWNKVTTDNGFELFASKTGKYLIIDNEGNPVLTQSLATAAAAAKATSDAAFSTDAEGMLNIKVGNTKEEGWASVDNVDESGNSLSGAELHIIDADTREVVEVEIDGQKVTSWESTGQPIAVKLPAGNYKLVEVTPPSGYTLAAPCEFTVTKQNNSTSNAVVVRMEDKLQPAGEISVLKVDENKVPLAGAKLAIVKKSDLNNYVKQWTSSASPMVFSTDDFEEGVEYQVFEIEPPFGYERNENVAYPTFTVRKNHSSQAANGSLSHPGVSVTHSTVKGSYIQLSKSGKTNIGYCVSMHNHYLTTTSSTDAVLLDDATSEFFNSNTTVSNKPGGRVNVNENMLKAIKHALYIGYPNDSANLLGKNLISEKDFYKVTQAVIWHYTTNGGFDSLSASYDNTWNTNWSGWYQGIFEARSTNANSWYQRIIRYIDALVAGNTNATLDGVNASGFGAPDSFKVNLFKFGSDQPVVETYPTEQVIPPLQLENKLRKGKITITKQWANEDGSSVSIPVDSVDVQLTRSVDGVPDDNFSQVITITKANNWVATQDGLDLVDSKTMKPYQYSISENTNVAGFSAIVTGPTTVETSKVTYNVATTSSSATWNATTYLSNNDTFVFTRSGDSKVLTVDGNSVKWVNLSGSSAANAPAEAQWKAILANSNNSSYYLQNVKTGKYLKLGNRVGNNGQSYWSYYYDCTGTTSNAERFRLVNYSSSYYSGSYALQGVTATSNSNGYGIEISTVDGQLSYYNTAYVKPYKKNVTSDTSTNQQDLYTEFEATVVNAGVKHDFELLKIDSSKLNSLPNSIDSLDSITDIDGLDGAVFTLKNNNEGDNKDAYLTKDNTWKNTTNKDAEVRFTTEDGKVSFGGLLAGSYILEEVQVPEHYVQAEGLLWNVTVKNDGTIEVETHANAVKDKFVVFGNAAAIVIGNDIQTYVLPATGGIGTTVFVIGGALLMLLAAALFVRRGAKKEA